MGACPSSDFFGVGKMRDLCFLTDENLVKMFKDGNEWCFNEIYNRYYNKLLTNAVFLIKSREDAEEIVNTALFKAFKYLNKFRGEASLYLIEKQPLDTIAK